MEFFVKIPVAFPASYKKIFYRVLGQFVPEFMHERIDVRSYERVGLAIQMPSFGSSKTVGYTGFRSSEHTNQQKGLLLIAVVLASAIFHHGFRLEKFLKLPHPAVFGEMKNHFHSARA